MKLYIIGDGDDCADLHASAKELPIHFTGHLSHAQALSLIAEARAIVSPSVCWETFGLTSVEAQSVGTPSVVSDLGGLPDTVVEGKTGFVFKHGDAEACAAAIRKVLSLDDAAFDRMASAAKTRVEARYTEDANYTELQKIYGNVHRVLLVHNYYGSTAPSGENKVFEAEKGMLEKRGVVVDVFSRHSDEIRNGEGVGFRCRCRKTWGLLKGALCTVANPFAAWALKKKIKEFKPEIVHFHNTFPLISPLALHAAHKSGCKVVMTLHNYRTVCAAGVPTRDGKVCSLCLDKQCVRDAIGYRCYRGSLLATLPLAMNIWLYRNKWAKWVDRFIVLSEFQRRKMVECGWPEEKLAVKGNFTEVCDNPILPAKERKDEILYVGRLSREKGVFTLIEAFRTLVDCKDRAL